MQNKMLHLPVFFPVIWDFEPDCAINCTSFNLFLLLYLQILHSFYVFNFNHCVWLQLFFPGLAVVLLILGFVYVRNFWIKIAQYFFLKMQQERYNIILLDVICLKNSQKPNNQAYANHYTELWAFAV